MLAADKIHCDDTPVPVLHQEPARRQPAQLWSFIPNEQPWASCALALELGHSTDQTAVAA
jgi:hypothetical protein